MSVTNKIIDTLICEDMMSVKKTVENKKSPLDKLKEKVSKLKPEFFGNRLKNNTKYTSLKQLQWLEKTHFNDLVYGCDMYRCTNNILAIHILTDRKCRYGCLLIYKCSDVESVYNKIHSKQIRCRIEDILSSIDGNRLLANTLVDNTTLKLISTKEEVVDISISLLFDDIDEEVVNRVISDDIDDVYGGEFLIRINVYGSETSVGFMRVGETGRSAIKLTSSFNGIDRYVLGRGVISWNIKGDSC